MRMICIQKARARWLIGG